MVMVRATTAYITADTATTTADRVGWSEGQSGERFSPGKQVIDVVYVPLLGHLRQAVLGDI